MVCKEATGKLVGELELDSIVDRCVDAERVMDPCVSGSRYISGSNGSWLKAKRDNNVVDGCSLSVDRHGQGRACVYDALAGVPRRLSVCCSGRISSAKMSGLLGAS